MYSTQQQLLSMMDFPPGKVLFGTKAWFEADPMPAISRESLDIFLRSSQCERLGLINLDDVTNAYKTYRKVQGETKIAYLHRKSERLILKERLIKNITDKIG